MRRWRGRAGREEAVERENMSMKAFAGPVDLSKGGDTRDGLTKGEIWLLDLTLLPSN